MTLKPWFALTLMAIGYVGAVAAGIWVFLAAFGTAFLTEDPLYLAFCHALAAVLSLCVWVAAGGRLTVAAVGLLVLLGGLVPFAVSALLAPYGAGFVAFAVMGAGVALNLWTRRSHEGPRLA